jgi:hypothetical protein
MLFRLSEDKLFYPLTTGYDKIVNLTGTILSFTKDATQALVCFMDVERNIKVEQWVNSSILEPIPSIFSSLPSNVLMDLIHNLSIQYAREAAVEVIGKSGASITIDQLGSVSLLTTFLKLVCGQYIVMPPDPGNGLATISPLFAEVAMMLQPKPFNHLAKGPKHAAQFETAIGRLLSAACNQDSLRRLLLDEIEDRLANSFSIVEESKHPYELGKNVHHIKIPGAQKLLITWHRLTDMKGYTIQLYSDELMTNRIANIDGNFCPIVLDSDRFSIQVIQPNFSTWTSCWGYKMYITPIGLKHRDADFLQHHNFTFLWWLSHLLSESAADMIFCNPMVYEQLVSYLRCSRTPYKSFTMKLITRILWAINHNKTSVHLYDLNKLDWSKKKMENLYLTKGKPLLRDSKCIFTLVALCLFVRYDYFVVLSISSRISYTTTQCSEERKLFANCQRYRRLSLV